MLYPYGDVDIQSANRHIQARLIEAINATAHTYEGIPSLIRKYYWITPDGGPLVGIYLWESWAAANAFYTADRVAMVTKRWARSPQRQEWEQRSSSRGPSGGSWPQNNCGKRTARLGGSRVGLLALKW